MDYDQSILNEFVSEAREHLDEVEDLLLLFAQQKDRPERETVDKVFRSIHSLKGGAGFLSLKTMEKLAHAMENLLSAIREEAVGTDSRVIDVLIMGVDLLKEMLEDVEQSNQVEITDVYEALVALTESQGEEEEENSIKPCSLAETGFQTDPEVLGALPPHHEYMYWLRYDLVALEKETGRSPVALIGELLGTGTIPDGRVIPPDGDWRQGVPAGPLEYELLYSTILDPDLIEEVSSLPRSRIRRVETRDLPHLAFQEEDEADAAASESDSQTDDPSQSSEVQWDPELALATPSPESPPPLPAESGLQPSDEATDTGEGAEPLHFQMPITPEVLHQYVVESDELMDRAEQSLCEIIDHPEKSQENLGETFRLIHSFKGNSGLLGLGDFERLSHRMETILEYLKQGLIRYREREQRLLLEGIDLLKTGLNRLSSDGNPDLPESGELVRQLDAQMADVQKEDEPEPEPGQAPSAPPSMSGTGGAREGGARWSMGRSDIRVDLEKLDVLINLVGELVIAESMVTRNSDLEGLELDGFERSAHNLRRIISDLQDLALSMRMIPLSRTFRKMIRLIHDLSARSHKKVRLELIGEETEVDKTVIEQIADPLVHIIRNSVDHGIESPQERKRAGKPETGRITLQAKHEGGEVIIRVSDDGQGLKPEHIRSKAVERGLISEDAQLSEEQIQRLIFEPGFSTAAQISDVSGRGVGMDVVLSNLERLKGHVDLRSQPGKGTTLILRIPLTLAIIDGMLVRVGRVCYTIPLLSIRESFLPEPAQITVTMDGQEIVRVRQDLIPVVRLHKLYNVEPEREALEEGILVNVASGGKQVCLFADEILGHHQTVIKGLPDYVGASRGISGCTILGDGEVSLILDVGHLIHMAEQSGAGQLKRRGGQGYHGE